MSILSRGEGAEPRRVLIDFLDPLIALPGLLGSSAFGNPRKRLLGLISQVRRAAHSKYQGKSRVDAMRELVQKAVALYKEREEPLPFVIDYGTTSESRTPAENAHEAVKEADVFFDDSGFC